MADYRPVTNALYGADIGDPSYYRTQLANALMGPVVTPESRDGRAPQSYGALNSLQARPQDWHDRTGVTQAVAGAVNPAMVGYGAGELAGQSRNALLDGSYGQAGALGLLAAMSVMPMKKARPEPTVRLFHGTNAEGHAGIMSSGRIDGPAYLGPRDMAARYGDHIVEAHVPKSKLQIDMDLGTNHMFSVEDANAYRKMQDFAADLDGPWSIDDYIKNGYAVGVPDGVVIK